MKTLIAIVNARTRQNTWATAVRATWLPQVPKEMDAFFFVGKGEGKLPADTIVLDCDDSYQGLPSKIKAIVCWALEHGYDFILKCDDDVVLLPKALQSCGYEQNDFSGKINRPAQPYAVSFGFNYWLSRKSMEIVAKSELPLDFDDEKWVAKNLWDHGIQLVNDNRYKLHMGGEVYPEIMFHRALRPARSIVPIKNPEVFSRCIHMEGAEEDLKLTEFRKVFAKYGEK